MRILSVMDDRPSEHLGLSNEHGLSFYLETEELRLLFDFGSGENTLKNARKLNIPLESLDYMVCSHGHYDHAGGYPDFLRTGVRCPLVTGSGFFHEKYAREQARLTYLGSGFGEELLRQHGVEHRICEGLLPLSEHCFVMNGFRRRHAFETIPERFVIRDRESLLKDQFLDELCLVAATEEGLVVMAGCSHPGILNMLESVREHFGRPIRAVVGGTHLIEASEERIRETLERMKGFGIELIGFNHCSGEQLRRLVREYPEFNAVYLGTGDGILL